MNVSEDTSGYLRINELKNYLYCSRISFYALCMGIDRETGLSHMGIEAEAEVKTRMKRRKHALHTVVAGKRILDVTLVSHVHRLIGKIDEVVETPEGAYLIDYKDTDRDYGYWKIQMCAYQLCAAESWIRPVQGCYVYSLPTQQYYPVEVNSHDYQGLERALHEIESMIREERCPPPTSQPGKCRVCQYARFCNDVF